MQFFRNDMPVGEAGTEAAADLLFEVAVPFRSLGLTKPNDRVQFYFELIKDGHAVERVPQEGAIETFVHR